MNKREFIDKIDIENNFDIFRKKIKISTYNGEIVFLTSLIDTFLLSSIIEGLEKLENINDILDKSNSPQIKTGNINDVEESFYSGCAILFIARKVYIIDCRKYPSRSSDEPYTEKSIRGSRDGFNEQINTNIGLIRLRIKSNQLVSELYSISKFSKTTVSLVYMKNKVDLNVVDVIRKRLNHLNISSLIMSDRSLEEKLLKQKYIFFPLVRYTERPDIACINIIKGKVILLVDTSPSVIILPITIFDHFKHVEEYRQPPIIGTLTKLIRISSIFISIFLSPIILCLYIDHDISNYFILNSDKLPSVISFEMITATLVLEIFRLATIHTPTVLGGTISLVSALVLGQVSIDLGIFSSEVLLVVCISAICGYATPSYELSLSNKFLSILLLLSSAFFKMEGFIVCLIFIFLYLVSIKTFNKAYLYPFIPFNLKDLLKFIFRENYEDKKDI